MSSAELMKARAIELRTSIFYHRKREPDIKQYELATHYKVTGGTISRHVAKIRNGWTPDPAAE